MLGYKVGLGALGGWIGLCAEILAAAALLWWGLRCGMWRAAAEQSRRGWEKSAQSSP